MTEKKLRGKVERLLGSKAPDEIWVWAKKERHMAPVLGEEEGYDVEYLVGQIQAELLRRGEGVRDRIESPGFVRKQRRQKGTALEREAISELVAVWARQRPDVEDFRNRVLQGRLLKANEVSSWISNIRDREPVSQCEVIVRVPTANLQRSAAKWELDPPLAIRGDDIVGIAPPQAISYGIPGSKWVHTKPIAPAGTLLELHHLCETLTLAYKWEPYQATTFVLTDRVPLVSKLQYQIQPKTAISALSRIRLTVDLAMTPRELYQEYGKIRRKILSPKKEGGSTRRPRPLTEKHARLAIFAAQIPNPELDTNDMKAWNRKHPKWRYSQFKAFNLAWKKAQRRLAKGPAAAFDYFKAFD